MLVSVAFKQVITSDLPQVSYLTVVDIYVLSGVCFIFFGLLCHGTVGALAFHHEKWSPVDENVDPTVAERWDYWLFIAFVVAWISWNALTVLYVRAQKAFNYSLQSLPQMRAHGFEKAEMANGDDVDDASDEQNWRCVFGKHGAPDGRISITQAFWLAVGLGEWRPSWAASSGYVPHADEHDPSRYQA